MHTRFKALPPLALSSSHALEQQGLILRPDLVQSAPTGNSAGVKPLADNYEGLKEALTFLKFDKERVANIVEMAGTVSKLASGIGTVLGAYETAQKLLTTLGILKGTGGPDTVAMTAEMLATVQRIYGYLVLVEQRGLYEQAMNWRVDVETTETAITTAAISASPAALDALERKTEALQKNLLEMLTPAKAYIAFKRSAYKSDTWINMSGSPFLFRANGDATPNLRSPSADMSTEFWDPGHYIDMLFASLRWRLAVAVAVEPLYRSTGYRLAEFVQVIEPLRAFVKKWKDSFMVANPSACMLGDGTLVNPPGFLDTAPYGIWVGAVDPVTGVSSLRLFDAFSIRYERSSIPGAAWGGTWDSSAAVDPPLAMHLAQLAHVAAVQEAVQASGVLELERILKRWEVAAQAPQGSDAVAFTDARHHSLGDYAANMPVPTQVDLGSLKPFAQDPEKTYPATRYYTGAEKVFTFTMARRTNISRTRLGYELRIGNRTFELTKWDAQPPPEVENVDYFPAVVIDQSLELPVEFTDCIQMRSMSPAEEDAFEASGRPGRASRVLMNARKGTARLNVRIEYQALAGNANNAHLGVVTVHLRPEDPVDRPDAYTVSVSVHETHVALAAAPPEPVALIQVLAEDATVHIIPSYLVAPAAFFTDLVDAQVRMAQAEAALASQLYLPDLMADLPTEPNPDPKFSATWLTQSVQVSRVVMDRAMRDRGVAEQVERFMVVRPGRPG